jgi:hypothetical protein
MRIRDPSKTRVKDMSQILIDPLFEGGVPNIQHMSNLLMDEEYKKKHPMEMTKHENMKKNTQ